MSATDWLTNSVLTGDPHGTQTLDEWLIQHQYEESLPREDERQPRRARAAMDARYIAPPNGGPYDPYPSRPEMVGHNPRVTSGPGSMGPDAGAGGRRLRGARTGEEIRASHEQHRRRLEAGLDQFDDDVLGFRGRSSDSAGRR